MKHLPILNYFFDGGLIHDESFRKGISIPFLMIKASFKVSVSLLFWYLPFFIFPYKFFKEYIFILFMFGMGYVIFYRKDGLISVENFKKPKSYTFIVKYFYLFLINLLIDFGYVFLLKFIHYDMTNYQETFSNFGVMGILYVCIIAPILEEIVYRGIICKH